jgi:DnaJ-class molecular chaperone
MKLELEEQCWNCGGDGTDWDSETGKTTPCRVCHGKGYTISQDGQAILDFIKKHLMPEQSQ